MPQRGSGILIHITALPSAFGIGDLGPTTYKFVEALARAEQQFWQILPLNPTDTISGNSPYNSLSACAGNILLISPEILYEVGLLKKSDIKDIPHFPDNYVDYRGVVEFKNTILEKAYQSYKVKTFLKKQFREFCDQQAKWLDDFALFVAIKHNLNGLIWTLWPDEFKNRRKKELERFKKQNQEQIDRIKFGQFNFFQQWQRLKLYCREHGVKMIGDMPIYVNFDSVDVWINPQYFQLDQMKTPIDVAGVPPDYFSETGQRWGNPVYAWDMMKKDGFKWWISRFKNNLELFDLLRIDHFRGLVQYWAIPFDEQTALKGKWKNVPTAALFKALHDRFGELPFIAEDLGFITEDVKKAMKRLGFPGMKVLLFAFSEDLAKHPYLPHNYDENCVVYTGTHDNNTIQGWYASEADEKTKKNIREYMKHDFDDKDLHWELISMAMDSKANTAIFPMQDVLGLGAESRMNKPATTEGNWQWRLLPEMMNNGWSKRLISLTRESDRSLQQGMLEANSLEAV